VGTLLFLNLQPEQAEAEELNSGTQSNDSRKRVVGHKAPGKAHNECKAEITESLVGVLLRELAAIAKKEQRQDSTAT